MTTVSRDDVMGLEHEGPVRQLLLSQFDRVLVRSVSGDGHTVDYVPENVLLFIDHAPNLFVALARAGVIPLSELDALQALRHRGAKLEAPPPKLAQVRTFDPTASVTGTKILLQFEGERRRRKHAVVPAETIPI